MKNIIKVLIQSAKHFHKSEWTYAKMGSPTLQEWSKGRKEAYIAAAKLVREELALTHPCQCDQTKLSF